MTNRVTVIGSLNVDTILEIPRLPKPGETLAMGDQSFAGGGKGANQGIAAGRAGADTYFIGKIGDDANGKFMVKSMTDSNINVDEITVTKDAKTGQAFILLDENGQNSILVYGGANQALTTADVDHAEATIAKSDFIITQFETPLDVAEAAFKTAKANDVVTILNPAPARQAIPASLMAVSDLVVPNETECQTLTGVEITDEASMIKGAEKLHEMGAKGVIITVGDKGAFYHTVDGNYGFVDAFKVKAVDTTAAGDTFIGALSSQLKKDFSNLPDAIRFANRASSITVQRMGAHPSIPTLAEIEAANAAAK
ncbi:ribokinase [Secundilactobacillus odoratitofui DSM 19909 = JCM 15043]|uniref:Ribokinase n=1 Tax=Secundilactobacillus odoratitofui DSM 19909 = JCM 15043 TaxID=1423776 RepID=A0A0R1M1C2_9LACO|nr:ribokinase [Secundilactobacillus odoratitofui]KRK98873.1 ribokinase [Secundilactobacillus odoratitofui DSM 19909 = JCM 15043]